MIVYALLAFCLLGANDAFLPTRLNFNDPELKDVFCPEQMNSPSINLKAITREGIRREIINLFNDDPPENAAVGFTVPETASLSEMFHQYYGANSSPTRFYSAVNTIAWANADIDSMESTKYDPKYHFDSEQITEGQALLSNRHNIIVASLLYNQSYDFARQQIGYSVHAIQDFYSHTNWFELGNTEILEGLAIPGFVIPNVADEFQIVCTSCSNADGSCTNNVVTENDLLTSGYYEYDIPGSESFIIEKPNIKCSHGGSLDTSRNKDPLGGINKATSSPCFSPHFYNHMAVAEMATEATRYYFSQIRFAVGNERFKFLFDLYQGSALVIVIDTTGSMSNEISVVQNQVGLIVESAPAELYILVPYADPEYGPVTRTTNSDEFLDAVNALTIGGGGGFIEEMVWSGLQLALLETPDYSTLYLFTDAGGVDYEKMDGDIAIAQEKNIICTVIYSYSNGVPTGPPYTDDTDYMNLAAVTGGAFIVIDDFDIEDVVSILGDGTESSMVALAIRRDISGLHQIPVLVDDTISSLQIVLTGDVTTAFMIASDAKNYNLLDQASLAGEATVNAFSTNIKDISFQNPSIGTWYIETDSIVTYSVAANGLSTLGYLMEFTEIDSRPPRPNYRLINGQPIAGLRYYAETVLVGWIENEVDIVSTLILMDDKGTILSEVENTEPVDDEFYIQTDPLPEERFYIGVNGQLKNGNGFIRLYETLITPAKIAVGVDLSLSDLSAPPGTTLKTVFIAYNNGPDATYDYFAIDDKGYVSNFDPESSLIESGQSESVEVTVVIPIDAVPWTQSTVIVTASSRLLSYDVNSDIAYVIVLPEELDTTAPICETQSELPDCTGYHSSATCDDGSWSITAIITDESELVKVYTQPSNNDTVLEIDDNDQLETGDSWRVTLTASCCVTQVDVIGVDSQGNIGTCTYDMGAVDGVLTFEVIDAGPTWIYLEWTVATVRPDLIKYRLISDGGNSINDIPCFDLVCHHNSTYLASCSLHLFELTPYYEDMVNGGLLAGATAFTDGRTTDIVPNPPINGVVVLIGPDATVSWEAPVNDQCIVLYEVCFTADDDVICRTTPITSLVVDDFIYCRNYTLEISSQTASGLTSEFPFLLETGAVDGMPGAPTDFHIVEITPYRAHLTWNAPTTNASCANDYTVNWMEVEEVKASRAVLEEVIEEFESVVFPLVPCTEYVFTVWANSPEGIAGPPAYTNDTSDEIDPPQPQDLTVSKASYFTLDVSWTPGGSICIGHYRLCWRADQDDSEWICLDLDDTKYTITQLVSCTRYAITLVTVSPLGVYSQPAFADGETDDEVPGALQNLSVFSYTNTTITISYDLPLENPQCVNEIDTIYSDLGISGEFAPDPTIYYQQLNLISKSSGDLGNTQEGLGPCSDYLIEINAVSPKGLQGPTTNTTGSTSEGTPSAPESLSTVIEPTSTSIILQWNNPEISSRCVVRYEIGWISENGTVGTDVVTRTSEIEFNYHYVMSDLLPSTYYDIAVQAYTELGTGGAVARHNEETAA